jgi:putative ABC transport system permease protein
MTHLASDLRYSLRSLARTPGFTAAAVLALALGVGANTAMFSVVNAALLQPLPFHEPERLVRIWETFLPSGTGSVSVLDFQDWQKQNRTFDQLAAYQSTNFNLQGQDVPERLAGAEVSAEFFGVLGVQAALGRTFVAGEDQPGAPPVVVLSDGLWRSEFGEDRRLVGRTIPINGQEVTVIGIMPPGFVFPARTPGLWMPLKFSQREIRERGSHFFAVIGRIKPTAAFSQADQDLKAIATRLASQYPQSNAGRSVLTMPLRESLVGDSRPELVLLFGAVGFVLLIACVNVANLLLARGSARTRETAIRTALGASRRRLLTQFLTESILLAGIGSGLGLMLALWGVELLVRLIAGSLPPGTNVHVDSAVLAFTAGLAVLAGIGFGLAPALHTANADPQGSLRDGSRGIAGSQRKSRLRGVLVATEIACAMILLSGAGLVLRSLWSVMHVEPGFRPDHVLTMRISLPATKYPGSSEQAAFHQKLLGMVTPLPGIEAAGINTLLPLQDWGINGDVEVEGAGPFAPGQAPLAEFRAVSADYFRAMGIPLVQGRYLAGTDFASDAPFVLVNRAFARRFWASNAPGGVDAVGKRIRFDSPHWKTIAGVVGDIREARLTDEVKPEVYIPYTNVDWPFLVQSVSLVIRTAGPDPTALASTIRREVGTLDRGQPIYNVKTMLEVMESSVAERRITLTLLGGFALLALLLASLGIFSVISYTVNQRSHEIGVRMALGARRSAVLRMVLRQGLVLALSGVGLGLVGTLALTRLMRKMLFEVSATDPLTIGAVALLLVFVAATACLLPARRATLVDPVITLRYQ